MHVNRKTSMKGSIQHFGELLQGSEYFGDFKKTFCNIQIYCLIFFYTMSIITNRSFLILTVAPQRGIPTTYLEDHHCSCWLPQFIWFLVPVRFLHASLTDFVILLACLYIFIFISPHIDFLVLRDEGTF